MKLSKRKLLIKEAHDLLDKVDALVDQLILKTKEHQEKKNKEEK